MTPLTHKTIRIGRAQREFRDDRIFVVATEDTYAPMQYFEQLPISRVKVLVLPTPANTGDSAPDQVVERLKKAFEELEKRREIQNDDEFWVLIDTDHHISGSHLKNLIPALRTARQAQFGIAISNPCFELWLLLHHTDVAPGTQFASCDEVGAELGKKLGGYNKKSIRDGVFSLEQVPAAIKRARALESSPDDPGGHWPETTGTRAYRLLERILGH